MRAWPIVRSRASITNNLNMRCHLIMVIAVIFADISGCIGLTRRSVIFPSGSIMQLSLGFGLNPNVEDTILNINFGFQQNVPLPTNVTQLREPPGARSGRKLQTQHMYAYLEELLNRSGFDGRECLQKCICQMAASEFSGNGIFEAILKFILTPTTHGGQSNADFAGGQTTIYQQAQQCGSLGMDCHKIYTSCQASPMDLLTVA